MNDEFVRAAGGLDGPSQRAAEAAYPAFVRDVPWHDEPVEIVVEAREGGYDVSIHRHSARQMRGGGSDVGVTYRLDSSYAVTSKFYPR